MAPEVKIGVIGNGQIGTIHLKRWRDVPGVKIVALCDIIPERAERLAEQYGVERTFKWFGELLAMDEIQAVDVCVHNNKHAPIAIAAMEAGKHVYTEKPMAGTYVDAKAMVDASLRTGRMLSMQLGTLFSAETQAARRLIDDGHLGTPYYAKSSYYRRRGRPYVDGYGTEFFVQKAVAGGGAFYDMGVYHISQILYLLGNPEVLTISGATHQEIDMYPDRRENGNYSVEELGIGLVRLAGGVTFFVEEAWAVHLGGTDGSKIAGSKGGVSLSPFAFHTTLSDMELNATFDLKGAQTRWGRCFPEMLAFKSAQHHWAAAVRGEVELLATKEIGLKTMLISEGVYLSQKLGREVTPAEVLEHSVSTAEEGLYDGYPATAE
jgi:predicted dehydrogenase